MSVRKQRIQHFEAYSFTGKDNELVVLSSFQQIFHFRKLCASFLTVVLVLNLYGWMKMAPQLVLALTSTRKKLIGISCLMKKG